MKKVAILKLLLWSVCVINGILALIGFTSGTMSLQVAKIMYGTTLTSLTGQADYLIKMMSCYLLGISFIAAFAAMDPKKYKIVVYGNAIWLAARALQRFIFAASIHNNFDISYTRIYSNGIFVAAIALLLILLVPREA
jgi:hypothetical protein